MLDSAPADAMTVVSVNVTYATENFSGTSGASTIIVPVNSYAVASGATSSDFANGFITFTLSNSATFAAVPPATARNVTLGTGSLVAGSTAVTYAVTSTGTSVSSVTIGNYSITGVGTRLATSTANITMTFSSIGSNVPTTASAAIATSSQAYSFVAGGSTATNIDLAAGGSGLVFRTAAPASNVTFATLGTLVQPGAATSNDIGGGTQFSATSSDTIRAVVNGNLSAFSSVYAATASCAATAPSGALTGTVSTDQRSATISPLALLSTYNICAIANGTTIIPAGTITGSISIAFAARTVSGATYTPASVSQSSSTLTTLAYNGSTSTAYYVVGLGSYISAIRLTNNSTSSGSVFVQVTPDTTGTPVRALLDSTLAAGTSKFYLASDIRAAVGTSVLTDSSNRATVVFLTSFTGLQLQNFIVNPGGVLSGGTSVGSANTTGN